MLFISVSDPLVGLHIIRKLLWAAVRSMEMAQSICLLLNPVLVSFASISHSFSGPSSKLFA